MLLRRERRTAVRLLRRRKEGKVAVTSDMGMHDERAIKEPLKRIDPSSESLSSDAESLVLPVHRCAKNG